MNSVVVKLLMPRHIRFSRGLITSFDHTATGTQSYLRCGLTSNGINYCTLQGLSALGCTFVPRPLEGGATPESRLNGGLTLLQGPQAVVALPVELLYTCWPCGGVENIPLLVPGRLEM